MALREGKFSELARTMAGQVAKIDDDDDRKLVTLAQNGRITVPQAFRIDHSLRGVYNAPLRRDDAVELIYLQACPMGATEYGKIIYSLREPKEIEDVIMLTLNGTATYREKINLEEQILIEK